MTSENGSAGRDPLTAVLVDTVGTTGQDDTLGLEGQIGDLLSAWQHLTVDIDLAQSPGQEMRLGGRISM